MNSIRLESPKIVHYGANHYGPEYLRDPVTQLEKDLRDSGTNEDIFTGRWIVVDFRTEGQCPLTANSLLRYLQDYPVRGLVAVYNTAFDDLLLTYRAEQHLDFCANFANWFTNLDTVSDQPTIDTKFLCLMRRPSVSRAKLANKLLTSLPSIRLSFGSMCVGSEINEYKQYVDCPLPILIDGHTDRSMNTLEHNQNNPVFRQSLFQVVVESGDQTSPNTWRSLFVTEKTFKAFGLRQIPIWFAVPGLVNVIRSFGFDMFDDIIDHSYDNIANEDLRCQAVVSQCIALDQIYSLEQCQELQIQLANRINNNYNLVKNLAMHRDDRFRNLMKELNEY
jgi:hypothetical protein